jgi:UDP-N-acetylglucosamine 1-carboxyvinyltransferase
MDRLIINGGRRPLQGRVRISGAKNAALAVLCASIMASDEVILDNVPNISDVRTMIQIIEHIGAKVQWLNDASIKVTAPSSIEADPPCDLVKKLRASNLLLGSLLAKFSYAQLSLPGGCNIGVRPMDLHFKGLASMGAQISLESGFVVGRSTGRLQGGSYLFGLS